MDVFFFLIRIRRCEGIPPMTMNCCLSEQRSRLADLDALENLDSDILVAEKIFDISGSYGKLTGVSRIPETMHGQRGSLVFFVDFADPVDAERASRALQCELCGVATLVIVVCRNLSVAIC